MDFGPSFVGLALSLGRICLSWGGCGVMKEEGVHGFQINQIVYDDYIISYHFT